MRLNTPLRPATLSSQIAYQLESRIASGEWPVGTRIPPENELAAQLGLSRNTVREALRSLIHLGMLEARAGDGTYVQAVSELEAPLMRRVHRARLEEAIELRAALERTAAILAAQRRTKAQAEELRLLVASLREAIRGGNADACATADAALHRAVAAATGNALLAEVYDHLGGALQLAAAPQLWDRALALEEIALHEALVEAIVRRDAMAAEKAAEELLNTLSDALVPQGSTV